MSNVRPADAEDRSGWQECYRKSIRSAARELIAGNLAEYVHSHTPLGSDGKPIGLRGEQP